MKQNVELFKQPISRIFESQTWTYFGQLWKPISWLILTTYFKNLWAQICAYVDNFRSPNIGRFWKSISRFSEPKKTWTYFTGFEAQILVNCETVITIQIIIIRSNENQYLMPESRSILETYFKNFEVPNMDLSWQICEAQIQTHFWSLFQEFWVPNLDLFSQF